MPDLRLFPPGNRYKSMYASQKRTMNGPPVVVRRVPAATGSRPAAKAGSRPADAAAAAAAADDYFRDAAESLRVATNKHQESRYEYDDARRDALDAGVDLDNANAVIAKAGDNANAGC